MAKRMNEKELVQNVKMEFLIRANEIVSGKRLPTVDDHEIRRWASDTRRMSIAISNGQM